MRKQIIMQQTINNLALAQQELKTAYRKCYLTLQHYLLTGFELAGTEEEKQQFKKYIKQVGETYKKTICPL